MGMPSDLIPISWANLWHGLSKCPKSNIDMIHASFNQTSDETYWRFVFKVEYDNKTFYYGIVADCDYEVLKYVIS